MVRLLEKMLCDGHGGVVKTGSVFENGTDRPAHYIVGKFFLHGGKTVIGVFLERRQEIVLQYAVYVRVFHGKLRCGQTQRSVLVLVADFVYHDMVYLTVVKIHHMR